MSNLHFDGDTFNKKRDTVRLSSQFIAVRDLMLDNQARTIQEIVAVLANKGIEATDQSVSARLRDLRKERFGGYTVERTYIANGLFTYRIAPFVAA